MRHPSYAHTRRNEKCYEGAHSGHGHAGQPHLSLLTGPQYHPGYQSRESGQSRCGRVQRKPRVAVMATSRELRDMADQMDREAERQPAVSEGRFPAALAGRLTGPCSGQLGKRPGILVQACQRAWKISAVFPSKWHQKRQQRSRKWRRSVERWRRRRTRQVEERKASRKAQNVGAPEKAKESLSELVGVPKCWV